MQPALGCAKRLKCVELAPAFGAATINDYACELDSVQTLRVVAIPIFSRIQNFRRWTALAPFGAGANMSAGFKSSSLAIWRQYSSFPIFG